MLSAWAPGLAAKACGPSSRGLTATCQTTPRACSGRWGFTGGLTSASKPPRRPWASRPGRRSLDILLGSFLIESVRPGRYQLHDLLRAYALDQARTVDSDSARTG